MLLQRVSVFICTLGLQHDHLPKSIGDIALSLPQWWVSLKDTSSTTLLLCFFTQKAPQGQWELWSRCTETQTTQFWSQPFLGPHWVSALLTTGTEQLTTTLSSCWFGEAQTQMHSPNVPMMSFMVPSLFSFFKSEVMAGVPAKMEA